MTPSSDSTHSLVSSGSMSGSWLGRPSLITGRLRSLATACSSQFTSHHLSCPPARTASRWPMRCRENRHMYSSVITVRTGSTPCVRDITEEAAAFVGRHAEGRGDGLLHVFVPHATAGIALIETGAGSEEDLLRALDGVLPAVVAPYATLPVIGGSIALGTSQSICLVDPNGDNPQRQVRFSFLPG